MKNALFFLAILLFGPWLMANDCSNVLLELKLPAQLKAGGKPRVARWEQVEKMMTQLRAELQGHSCEFSFGQVFQPRKSKNLYFPILGNVLRTAPEESLKGATVFNQDAEMLGRFANRVMFEKKGYYNYTNFYFQFKDGSGELQSSGNRFLIDIGTRKPFFLVKWDEIQDRVAISTR